MAGQPYLYKNQVHKVLNPVAQRSGKLFYPASDLILASLLLLIILIILLG